MLSPCFKTLIMWTTFFVGINCQSLHYDCGADKKGIAAITFDDGPSQESTYHVLDVLRDNDVKATFFLVGLDTWESNRTRYHATVQRMINEGHQIGSHTWSHPDLTTISDNEIRGELRRHADLIYSMFQRNMTVFRPPFGSYNDRVLEIAQNEFNYDVIIWSVDTSDWLHGDNAAPAFQEWVNAVADGGVEKSYIGLHHDPYSGHTNLTQMTIDLLKSANISITTVADCIGRPMFV